MYQQPNNSYGTDLAAIMIQQGRDQGIPSYFDVAKKCKTLEKVENFSSLIGIWATDTVHRVEGVYKCVKLIIFILCLQINDWMIEILIGFFTDPCKM